MLTPSDIIYCAAIKVGVDPLLLTAICKHESALSPEAVRYEPHYKWLHFPREHASRLSISYETECALQSFSYGLPQVMGAVLREYGYQRPLQMVLLDQEVICEIAARHIKSLQTRYSEEAEVIAAYNAGSAIKMESGMFKNQRYVDSVYFHLTQLRRLA